MSTKISLQPAFVNYVEYIIASKRRIAIMDMCGGHIFVTPETDG